MKPQITEKQLKALESLGQTETANRIRREINLKAKIEEIESSQRKTAEQAAKGLDFQTGVEYFDYCIDSHINGNFSQCERLFKDLTKADQKNLLNYISESYTAENPAYKYYFKQL